MLRQPRGISTPAYTLKARPNGRQAIRVCFIVSTKVSKRATERNRIRRRLSEAFRRNWSAVPAGYDLVIIGRRTVLDLSFADLTASVMSLSHRLPPFQQV